MKHSGLGSTSRQNELQKARFKHFLALAPEVDKMSSRRLDLKHSGLGSRSPEVGKMISRGAIGYRVFYNILMQSAVGYRVFYSTFVQGAIGYRVFYSTFVQRAVVFRVIYVTFVPGAI